MTQRTAPLLQYARQERDDVHAEPRPPVTSITASRGIRRSDSSCVPNGSVICGKDLIARRGSLDLSTSCEHPALDTARGGITADKPQPSRPPNAAALGPPLGVGQSYRLQAPATNPIFRYLSTGSSQQSTRSLRQQRFHASARLKALLDSSVDETSPAVRPIRTREDESAARLLEIAQVLRPHAWPQRTPRSL